MPVRLIAQNAGESTPAVVATTTSDAAGHWVLNAPQGPSRKLTIVYGTQTPTPEGGVTISQSVKPKLTLRIRALGRARLRFTGRLGDRAARHAAAARRHPGAQRQRAGKPSAPPCASHRPGGSR